jgi:enterochelin esterase-like enzyme
MQSTDLDVNTQSTYTEGNRRPRRPADPPPAGGAPFSKPLFLLLGALIIVVHACSMKDSSTPAQSRTPPTTTQSFLAENTTNVIIKTPTGPPPQPLFTPTQVAIRTCLAQDGKVEVYEVDDPTLTRLLSFRVYLPPCYAEADASPYPSLYLLHGAGYSDSHWQDLGIDARADTLIERGEISPLIIIMPWDRTGLDLEAAITEWLIPHIDQTYYTQTGSAARAIGGISRGAGLALSIGLKHPDLFSAIGLHSPANLYSDPYIVDWVTKIPSAYVPKLWIDIGDKDPLLDSATALGGLLDELKVPLISHVNPGDHSSTYWSSNLDSYLEWYGSTWP